MNHVTATGNLTRDPELRYSNAGNAVCSFSVASSRSFKRNDEWQETTVFLRCVTFGDLAEHVSQSVSRGDRVTVTGRLEADDYTDKDGNERKGIQIVAEGVAIDLKYATAVPERVERSQADQGRTTNRDRAAAAAAQDEPF